MRAQINFVGNDIPGDGSEHEKDDANLADFSQPNFPVFDFSVFENGNADEQASDGSARVSDDAGGGRLLVDEVVNLEPRVEAGKDQHKQKSDEADDFSVPSFRRFLLCPKVVIKNQMPK